MKKLWRRSICSAHAPSSSALVMRVIETSSSECTVVMPARHYFSLQRLQILPVLPCKPPCFSLFRKRAQAGRKSLIMNT